MAMIGFVWEQVPNHFQSSLTLSLNPVCLGKKVIFVYTFSSLCFLQHDLTHPPGVIPERPNRLFLDAQSPYSQECKRGLPRIAQIFKQTGQIHLEQTYLMTIVDSQTPQKSTELFTHELYLKDRDMNTNLSICLADLDESETVWPQVI